MSRASTLELVQVGVETTPGTAVAANKRLMCTDMRIRPRPRVSGFGSPGSKVDTHVTQAKGHAELAINCPTVGYHDIAYLLASLLRVPTGAFVYDLTPFAADTIKTLSIERGQAARAEKAAYGVVSSLDFRFTETEVSASGGGFCRTRSEGATMTATPTILPAVAISPKDWRVQVGTDVAGLAAITKPLEARLSIQNRWRPNFFGNSDASFTEHGELKPNLTAALILEHDSVAAGYMADLEASTQRVMRILAQGAEITTGVYYLFQATFPFTFRENEPGDVNDDVVSTFNLGLEYEEDFGSAVEIEVVNTLSSL